LVLLGYLFTPIYAENLGVYGALYPIGESDFLSGIFSVLHDKEISGELRKQQEIFQARSIEHIVRPMPVQGVDDLSGEPHSHFYDPTLTLTHPIFDRRGLFVAAGTSINPLKEHNFDEALVFINGDNLKQQHWVIRFIEDSQKSYRKIKIILVRGNIKEVSEHLQQKIYFDQAGFLCHIFHIEHTPTIVTQAIEKTARLPKLLVQEVSYE
jgi:conjugal transfer pilus assembly protein TraW